MKVAGRATQLAHEFDATMADVIKIAESCSDEQWTRRHISEERTVGVLFDHIAAGNDQAVGWASSFLRNRAVEVDPGLIDSENAAHARETRDVPRSATIKRLQTSTRATSRFLHRLTDAQLEVIQTFGWLGPRSLAFVVIQTCRHPQRHLQSIREALQA